MIGKPSGPLIHVMDTLSRAPDKGRKRHIATDTLGLLLVLLVTAASVQDTTGGRDVSASWPPGTRH